MLYRGLHEIERGMLLRPLAIAIADGARRTPDGKAFVTAPSVNTKVVNRGAPDLFPATCLVKRSFTRRKIWTIAPFDLTGDKMA